MGRFRSGKKPIAKKAAEKMAKGIARDFNAVIASLGTRDTYQSALRGFARALARRGVCLREATVPQALDYLAWRATNVREKTLNKDHCAIQAMFRHVTFKLAPDECIARVHSEIETSVEPRAYTEEQVAEIARRQRGRNALCTLIAYRAGLRAHELLTLNYVELQPPDNRDYKDPDRLRELKFASREGALYTVVGKGGLIRTVLIPWDLAERLEALRLDEPVRVTDRGIFYYKHYDIGGGHAWSKSFSRASVAALGWSSGAHGVRHSYAQERFSEIAYCDTCEQRHTQLVRSKSMSLAQEALAFREMRKKIVSYEVGHFRAGITEVYLV